MEAKLPHYIVKGVLVAMAAVVAVTVLSSVLALLSFVLTIVVIGALIVLPLNMLFGQGGIWHGYWRHGMRLLQQAAVFGGNAWRSVVGRCKNATASIGDMSRACGVFVVELFCGVAIGILAAVTASPEVNGAALYFGGALLGGVIGFLVGWSRVRLESETANLPSSHIGSASQ